MKKSEMTPRIARRVAWLLAVLLIGGGVLFAWQRHAAMQSENVAKTDMPKTVAAAKRGNPYVNLEDGRELDLGANASGTQSVALASADFDSDGITDVVTADTGGSLQLLKGRGQHLFAPDGKNQKPSPPEPFLAIPTGATVGFSPDEIFAGDLNADGKPDILAYRAGSATVSVNIGDGLGHFSQAINFAVSGNISYVDVGEIGRRDGQADVVVTFSNQNGHFAAVYEHPESAFKHPPEIFKLSGPATAVAIGNLDEDFYADIAVASGNDLTVIHGRGHVGPWDLVKPVGIKRPSAVIETRRMPVSITSMTVGRFGEKRGTSLAMLGSDGNIYNLESAGEKVPTNNRPTPERLASGRAPRFRPTDASAHSFRMEAESIYSPEIAKANGVEMADAAEYRSTDYQRAREKRRQESADAYSKLSKEELELLKAEGMRKKAADELRSKAAFLNSISSASSHIKTWKLRALSTGSTRASAATSGGRIVKVNVSSSDLDDLMITTKASTEIRFSAQIRSDETNRHALSESAISATSAITAILPVRANLDAQDDLVILSAGASSPSIVLSAPMNTFVVDVLDESGPCTSGNPCSLRNAITLANNSPGIDQIFFSISGKIAPTSALPVITEGVSIIGISNFVNFNEISGENMAAEDGFKLRSSGSTIAYLTINRFPGFTDPDTGSQIGGNGITMESTTLRPNNGNNLAIGNYLGTNTEGFNDLGNHTTGILIFDSDNNTIQNNVMSGNGSQTNRGVGLAIIAGNTNNVIGNIIGLDTIGFGKIPNSDGILLMGSDNNIGGDGALDGNTVSGNGEPRQSDPLRCDGDGIKIETLFDLETGQFLTLNNNLKGNKIGTNPLGAERLGNCWQGVEMKAVNQTIVGSITPEGRNIISGNGLDAIWCNDPFYPINSTFGGFCSIAGNNIGTDITGNLAIPNDQTNQFTGLHPITNTVYIANNQTLSNLGSDDGTTQDGDCTGSCNLISGNFFISATQVEGYGIAGVFENYVGTNITGTAPITNNAGGIGGGMFGDLFVGYADETTNLGNLASGNDFTNLNVGTRAFGSAIVQGNRIGTDRAGLTAVPSTSGDFFGEMGIFANSDIFGTILIGGDTPNQRNIVSGNRYTGIFASDFLGGQTLIRNNLIGVNIASQPLGNGGNGIHVRSSNTQVGGSPELGNVIAHNGSSTIGTFGGVTFGGWGFGAGSGITIRGNSIYDNNGLGIDLSLSPLGFQDGDGVTLNDDCDNDFDVGPNGLQNFPVLAAPVTNGNGTQTVPGILKSHIRESYTIDFYSTATADPSGHGEGQTYLGSTTVTTDGNGFGEFEFVLASPVPANHFITATTTDGFGSTSEFSQPAGASARSIEELRLIPQTCAAAIVVNINTDEPDANINDNLCDVDTGNDGLQCSLRAAMQEADHRLGYQRIIFAIPGAGPHMISPADFLPTIDDPVDIDATTQDPSIPTPSIHLNGAGSAASTAFAITGVSAYVRGFAITGFSSAGIFAQGGAVPFIESCHIGIAPDGVTSDPGVQMPTGIRLINAPGAMIGGDDPSKINVISNNNFGVLIQNTEGARLRNNRIGTNRAGTEALPNQVGVSINASTNTEVGRDITAYPNVISGNAAVGVDINTDSNANKIYGNFIGTNLGGTAPLPNGQIGVYIQTGARNTGLGTPVLPNSKNVISGHNLTATSSGVQIEATAGIDNSVAYNHIGVSLDASTAIPNRNGVTIFADDQSVTGSSDLTNIISGNADVGVLVARLTGSPNQEIENVRIKRNRIGTNHANATDIANGRVGVWLVGVVNRTTVENNVVSGNGAVGIFLSPLTTGGVGPSMSKIFNNKIGSNENGDAPIPNVLGIGIRGSSNNQIYSNTISGNSSFGMLLGSGYSSITPEAPASLLEGLSEDFKRDFLTTSSDQSLVIEPTSFNRVWDNRIGVTRDGNSALTNHRVGLWVGEYAHDNCIGSCDPNVTQGGVGNTISAHDTQLGIGVFVASLSDTPAAGAPPNNNLFRDNTIGVSRNYQTCLPNRTGMLLFQTGSNRIGEITTIPGFGTFRHGNIVTCNTVVAIELSRGTDNTVVRGNFVGVVPNFRLNPLLPPGSFGGIRVLWTIGIPGGIRDRRISDNVIGMLRGTGIDVTEGGGVPIPQPRHAGPMPPSVEISGNLIGVQPDENGVLQPVPNQVGIRLNCVTDAYIGDYSGSGAAKNIIAANLANGVEISSVPEVSGTCQNSGSNTVTDSIIGTDNLGTTGLGNGANGIAIMGSEQNRIDGNVVGGNVENGIYMSGDNNETLVTKNKVGFLVGDGGVVVYVPNLRNGIELNNAQHVTVGGAAGQENVISANLEHGVLLTNGAASNKIGTEGFQAGNVININGGAGVRLNPTAGLNNRILQNSTSLNGGLGVDFGEEGITANDPGDADEGPNRLQNYPQINLWDIVNGDLLLNYRVDSLAANSNYGASGIYVEFFESDLSGEGERFIGSNNWTLTDLANGGKVINLGNAAALGIVQGDLITASATDADGNTSEFFPPFSPTAANISISGRIVEPNGNAIRNATLTLTDTSGHVIQARSSGFGWYRFEDVEAGRTYVLAVSHRRYTFANPSRVLSVTDELTDVNFTSDP